MIEDLSKYKCNANSSQLSDTVIYKYLKSKNADFYCSNLEKITSDVASLLTRIPAMFSNYTNHDITHSFRIADYMVSLLPQSIENYSDTELVIMLFSAIFHDVGMCVSETESDLDITKQDEIRRNHHNRSENYVLNKANTDYFKIDNTSAINFKKIVASIARSHGEDFNWIKENIDTSEEYGIDTVNPLFISCLLRLGDYLDFDSRRTPYCLYDFLQLKAASYEEWKKHFPITNYKKVNEQRQIYFTGTCESPEVYHQILKYFRNIEDEIKKGKELLENCSEKYELDIEEHILNKIKHETFSTVDLQYKMDYVSVSTLLMGENLYSDKSVVIRELLQNSIDACLVKKELCDKKSLSYNPEIKILLTENDFSIEDNGIGMTKNTIENYFLCVGKSFYNSESYVDLKCSYQPISHYGIGFLSCFLLSDTVDVTTIPYEDKNILYKFTVEKKDRDVEIKTIDQENEYSGTKISFDRKNVTDILNAEYLKKYIEELFFHIPVPINIYSDDSLLYSIEERKIDMKNRIDISNYLNNIECSFKTLKPNIINRINKLDYPFSLSNSYIYAPNILPDMILDEEDLYNYQQNTGETWDIKNFISPKDKVQILRIYPLDSDAEDYYDNYFEYEDDAQEAFEKTFKEFPQESISVLINDSKLLNEFNEYEKVDIPSKSGTQKYKHFVEKISELLLKLNYDVDSFLCNIDINNIFYNENFYSFFKINKEIRYREKNALAFHNIRLSQYQILIPSIIDSFMSFQWYINVKTQNAFPSISRDTLSQKISSELGYALGYAYNMYLMEQEIDSSKKEFLKEYIEKFYSEENIFIRR